MVHIWQKQHLCWGSPESFLGSLYVEWSSKHGYVELEQDILTSGKESMSQAGESVRRSSGAQS